MDKFDIRNRTLRILVVDDDRADFILVRSLLEEIEDIAMQIDWESDYTTALRALQGDQYDLCLLDYFLGGHNGIDLLNAAVSSGSHVSFVMLTGRGNRQVDLSAMEYGADFYVDKNQLDAYDLERAIRYSLEHNWMVQALRQLNDQLEVKIGERTQMLVEAKRRLEELIAERERSEVELREVRVEREQETLNHLAHPAQTRMASKLSNIPALQEGDSAAFNAFVERYSQLIEQMVEQVIYKVDHNVTAQLLELGCVCKLS